MTSSTDRIGASERRRIASVFFWSILSLFVLYILFSALTRRQRMLGQRIHETEARLSQYETREIDGTLAERILAQRQKKQYLLDEWKRYSNLLETWKSQKASEEGELEEAARIDFKVALFNARDRLNQRAIKSGTKLPEATDESTIPPVDIGISESIGTDENTSVRLLQLAAVQRLVGFAVDLNVPEILEIEAMEPKPVPAADGGDEYLDQYPVRLKIRCSLDNFVQFLAQLMRAQHFFAIANVFAEKTSRQHSDLLDVTVVLNALVLKEKEP